MAHPIENFGIPESPEPISPDVPIVSLARSSLRIVPDVIEVNGKILLAGVEYAEPGWDCSINHGVYTDLEAVAYQTPRDIDEEPLRTVHPFHDADSLHSAAGAHGLGFTTKAIQCTASRLAISTLLL